jgi:hypothetical protein
VFVDGSGFLLIPTVRRTWAPRGETPYLRHRYRHDRLSVCSGVAVSPARRQIALYLHCRPRNLRASTSRPSCATCCVTSGAPSICSGIGVPSTGAATSSASSRAIPGCTGTSSPPTRPNSTPAEYVWGQADRALANGAPDDLAALRHSLGTAVRRLRRSHNLLWSCIYASALPWTR